MKTKKSGEKGKDHSDCHLHKVRSYTPPPGIQPYQKMWIPTTAAERRRSRVKAQEEYERNQVRFDKEKFKNAESLTRAEEWTELGGERRTVRQIIARGRPTFVVRFSNPYRGYQAEPVEDLEPLVVPSGKCDHVITIEYSTDDKRAASLIWKKKKIGIQEKQKW